MAVFNFDQADEYVQEKGAINFFKLQDNGWQAKVRFMYGPGEVFQGYSVHNIGTDRNKFVPCLKELGQPLDVCPLCKAGTPVMVQFFIPLFVESISRCVNGILQPEEEVKQVMIFQRGKQFQGSLASAIRQCKGTPLVSNLFNIVRNGKAGDTSTTYVLEHIQTDATTLDMLPERPQVYGSYILPDWKYEDMVNHLNGAGSVAQSMVTPRQVSGKIF